jgi:hypothetical protein
MEEGVSGSVLVGGRGSATERSSRGVECNALSAWTGVRRKKVSVWKVKRRQAWKEDTRKERNWTQQNVKE